MALYFNGVEIPQSGGVINFNGNTFTKVYFNDVLYWQDGGAGTCPPPPVPDFCDATDGQFETHVLVQWGYSDFDAMYTVERSDDDGTTFTQVADILNGDLWYEDHQIEDTKVYHYRVKACFTCDDDSTGACSAYSEIDTGFRDEQVPCTCPPTKKPDPFSVGTPASYYHIFLQWGDNGETDAKGVNIYRGESADSMVLVDWLPFGGNTYKDFGVVNRDIDYFYKMCFYNDDGEGPFTDTLEAVLSSVVYVPPHTHYPLDLLNQGHNEDGDDGDEFTYIDSDTVDGFHGDEFRLNVDKIPPADIFPQGIDSTLDADTVDGMEASEFAEVKLGNVSNADFKAKMLLNDGAGSGLDADLLDGEDSDFYSVATHTHDQYLRTDADDTASGKYHFSYTGDASLESRGAITIGDVDSTFMTIDGNEIQAVTVTDGVSEGTWLGLNANGGEVTINGEVVWHQGNDGSGSGLNADLLDGKNLQSGSTFDDIEDTIPFVSGGILDVGNYIDFHEPSGSAEYDTSLQSDGGWIKMVNQDGASGNIALGRFDEASGTLYLDVKV